MNAIALLVNEHRKVAALLKELEATTERGVKTREKLFAELKESLRQHEKIEEEIFYPALRSNAKAKDLVLESYEEHHLIDAIIEEMESLDYSDEVWTAKFTVLKENIEHHVHEEEHDLFPKAKGFFDKEELNTLGQQMTELEAAA